MKGLGALLVLLGAVLGGAGLCRERRKRQRLLRDLIQGLTLILGELQLHAAPLGEVLSAAERAAGGAGTFFAAVRESMELLGEESFSDLWKREAEERLSALPAAARDELVRLGAILGRVDLESETEGIAACRNTLTAQLETERAQTPGFQKLTLGLCACAGALLAIILF